jgi:hypothetical protein
MKIRPPLVWVPWAEIGVHPSAEIELSLVLAEILLSARIHAVMPHLGPTGVTVMPFRLLGVNRNVNVIDHGRRTGAL